MFLIQNMPTRERPNTFFTQHKSLVILNESSRVYVTLSLVENGQINEL